MRPHPKSQLSSVHVERLPLSRIRVDGGTQARVVVDPEVVSEYADAMVEGECFPPVIVFHDGRTFWLGDGFHRVEAARRAKRKTIDVEVRDGTRRDAVLHAAGANAEHGLRRTNADKRRAVSLLLVDEEWRQWSDHEIARRCRVSQPFVSALRKEVRGRNPIAVIGCDSRRAVRGGQVYSFDPTGIRDARKPLTVPQKVARDLASDVVAAVEERMLDLDAGKVLGTLPHAEQSELLDELVTWRRDHRANYPGTSERLVEWARDRGVDAAVCMSQMNRAHHAINDKLADLHRTVVDLVGNLGQRAPKGMTAAELQRARVAVLDGVAQSLELTVEEIKKRAQKR